MDILIALLTVAEIGVVIVGVGPALIAHAVLLLAFLWYAGTGRPAEARFATAVALLPLLRILSFTVPLPRAAITVSYGLTNLALLVAIGLCMWRLRLTLPAIGLRVRGVNWFIQALIALSGIAIAVVAARVFGITSADTGLAGARSIWLVLAVCFDAIVEEILYRGVLQTVAVEMIGGIGYGLTLILYTVMSLGTPTPPLILLNMVSGAWWVFCAGRTRALWGVAIGHALFIIALVMVF